MTKKERIKSEIDQLDESCLETVHNILRQFPHLPQKNGSGEAVAHCLQEIADLGGLGIQDPAAWQRDIRSERNLPNRVDNDS